VKSLDSKLKSALYGALIYSTVVLRAEALCAINQPEQALVHLNTIRTARGMSAVSYKKDFNSDKSKVIQAVLVQEDDSNFEVNTRKNSTTGNVIRHKINGHNVDSGHLRSDEKHEK
jgi:hypothetical protein